MLEAMHSVGTARQIIAGDFNAVYSEDSLGKPPPRDRASVEGARTAPRKVVQLFVDARYVDCFRNTHRQATGYTYPSDAPWARIDFVLASPPIAKRIVKCDVITGTDAEMASDHLPVLAEFSG